MSPDTRSTVTQVLATVLDGLAPLPGAPEALGAAGGRVLAADVTVPTPLPPEARSAMDGVAVRAADVATASPSAPCRLPVDGASLAGHGDRRPLPAGTAREIATGAPMPPGADAVVRIEDLRRDDDCVELVAPVTAGHDVRPVGEDAPAGHVLASRGRVLDAGALGGLAGAGIEQVWVVPAPRVAVVPTGDEVVSGETPDAVGPLLRHLLAHDGAQVSVATPVRDDPGAITAAVAAHAEHHDLVVTVGGVSVGPRDHAADLVADLARGQSLSLALHPGRPFAWGRTASGVTVLCLPGTPMAALAAAAVLVRPVVARLSARPAPRPSTLPLCRPAAGDPSRRSLVPAAVVDGQVRTVPGHGSANLARLAATSALVDLPAGTGRLDAGALVDVWPLP